MSCSRSWPGRAARGLVSTPAHSLAHAVTFGAGAVISGPVYAAFPVWLIVLSYRLPGHAGSPGQLV